MDVVDDFTVRITTKKPYGSLLGLLASDFGKLMNSPTAVEKAGKDYGRNPVGTGPFKFLSWTPGVKLVIEKNPNYWRGAPAIDSVEFRPSPEGSARVLALETGDVDLINQVPAQDLARFQEDSDVRLVHMTLSRLFYWAFNNTKGIWSDPNIRIALNRAVDRKSIVKNVLYGSGEVANSYISPTVAGSTPIDVYGYDPIQARKMLEEANFPFDKTLTLYATEGRYYQDRQVAEAVLQRLGAVAVLGRAEAREPALEQVHAQRAEARHERVHADVELAPTGQQQRVLLARAMAQAHGGGRGVMLLDEPVSAMDLRYLHRCMRLLTDIAQSGRSVLVVLHDLNLAATYADDVWLMSEGRLVACGSWRQVLQPAVLEPIYGVVLQTVQYNELGDRPHFVVKADCM